MTYRGDQDPSILTEEVVLKYSPIEPWVFGYYTGSILMQLIAPIVLTSVFIIKVIPPENSIWGVVCIPIILGLLVGTIIHAKQKGTEIVADSERLVTRFRGNIVQSCSWNETRVRSNFVGQRWLTDQTGRKFPFIRVRGKQPGSILLRQVVRTRLRQPGPTTTKEKMWLGAILTVGLVALFLTTPLQHHWVETLGNRHSTSSDKEFGFLYLFTAFCTAYLVLFATIVLLNIYELRNPKTPSPPDKITAFIESRKGRLKAANLESGEWFAYVEGAGFQKPSMSQIALCSILLLLFPALVYLCTMCNDPGFNYPWMFWTFMSVYVGVTAILIVLGFRRRSQAKLSLNTELCKSGEAYTIRPKGGDPIPATSLQFSKNSESPTLDFGAISWGFRGADGLIYFFDPRYLVTSSNLESEITPRLSGGEGGFGG